jgi:hypothetical protein
MPASGVKSSALLQPELGKPAYLGRAAIDMATGGAGRARRAHAPNRRGCTRLHAAAPGYTAREAASRRRDKTTSFAKSELADHPTG